MVGIWPSTWWKLFAAGDRPQREWAFRTGLAFLLALIVFVTVNDVVPARFFGS
jgi:hypothetical protein